MTMKWASYSVACAHNNMFDAGKLSEFKIAQDPCLSEFSGAPQANLRDSAVEKFF